MQKHNDRQANPRYTGLFFCITIVFIVIFIWQIGEYSEKKEIDSIRSTGQTRVTLYTGSLIDALEKYRPIPYLLSRDQRIRNLLRKKLPPLQVNPHLEDFSITSGTLIYVLNQNGLTVASSNWRSPQSLVSNNYSFRPYFLDAKDGKPGSYYAIGLRTGTPGFFISYPVLETGKLLGVVVVKVDLEKLQQAWQESGETIIVSDSYGVLFLSSNPSWKYRSLRPLPESTKTWLQQAQYLQKPLTTLPIERDTMEGGNRLVVDNKVFLEQSLQLVEYGWRIHYLTDLQPVKTAKQLTMAVASILSGTLLLSFLFLRERKLKQASQQQAKEASAIKQLNEQLEQEIQQRRKTEASLRKTQKELIQASKLAALGNMSAAIAHELNQPVTAMKTFIASSKILLEREQKGQVQENLQFIGKLTERMSNITGQLKTFARKTTTKEGIIDLSEVTEQVLNLTSPLLRKENITISKSLLPPQQALVHGNKYQLEQVLSNLLHNAIDATLPCTNRAISISLFLHKNNVILTCHDTGNGIAEENIEFLFDPFYTTKDIGKGLGLGLSISYGIIQELGGTIRAENHPDGGALFTLQLPLYEEQTR